MRSPKSGWPAVGVYQLTQFPDRFGLDNTFLVGGYTPVYYIRVQPGNYDNPEDLAGSCDDGNRDEYRAQYFARLVETSLPVHSGLEPYSSLYVSGKARAHTDSS